MTDNMKFPNDSLSHLNSSNTLDVMCFSFPQGYIIITPHTIITILLLLPLCIFILYQGFQQWKQNRSSSLLRISHSDFLTYHAVIMELVGIVGHIMNCYSFYNMNIYVLLVSTSFLNISRCGQICFHILTCVDRYLAVVHPVTYLNLKNEKGIRIRNTSIVCAWLLCFLGDGLSFSQHGFIIVGFCFLIFALIVTSFCNVADLCVLIRSGPGDQVGGLEKTDQVKRRAFYTVLAILGVLVLKFSINLIQIIFFAFDVKHLCEVNLFEMWLSIPSSLLLPFLFLQKTGKLQCCKRKQNVDQQ